MKRPPQQVFLPSSLLENPNQQPLLQLRPSFRGVKEIPPELGTGDVATLIFVSLLDCFKRAEKVCEGLLGDLIWGFEQCGIEPRATAAGLTRLRVLGYIRYTDETGSNLSEINFDPTKLIWIRYTSKFLNLIASEDRLIV